MDLAILRRIPLRGFRGIIVAWVLLAGCEKHSALYCEKHPSDTVNCPPADSGAGTCSGNAQCMTPTPICELGSHTCVECLAPTDCTSLTAPLCANDHACHGCSNHTECLSAACLPDGSCALEADVAYVTSNGNDNGTCDRAAPCRTIGYAIGTLQPVVKLVGGGMITENVSISSGIVTILADPGIKLTESSNNPELSVSGSARVEVSGLDITNNGGNACVTLANTATLTLSRLRVSGCSGSGISTTGGSLTVSRATVQMNSGGGIRIANGGTFDITNTFIVKNGNSGSGTTAGATLVCASGPCRFEFNTVADNVARMGVAGVACDFTFQAPNNIITHNVIGSGTGTEADTLGACTYPTSAIQADPSPLKLTTDFHISAGSSAIDQALTASPVDVDRDGDHRPQGAAKDQGADELQ